MSKETAESQSVDFGARILELMELGREHGSLVYEDIKDRLSAGPAAPISIETVCLQLQSAGIQILKEEEAMGISRLEEEEGRKQERLAALDDPVWVYLKETRRTPPLTRLHETAACRRLAATRARLRKALSGLAFATIHQLPLPRGESARAFGELARCAARVTEAENYLVRAELPLVLSLAAELAEPEFAIFEFLQDGNRALLEAVEHFDCRRRGGFSAFAGTAIREAITRTVTRKTSDGCADPDAERDFSAPEVEVPDAPPLEVPAPGAIAFLLAQVLARLGEVEHKAVELRFGLGDTPPMTVQGTARTLGLSRAQVRQIERRTLQRLRPGAQIRQIGTFSAVHHITYTHEDGPPPTGEESGANLSHAHGR